MKKLNKKGFTLIELIVVIGILAVLALILVPSILGYVNEARDARDLANARSIYSELMVDIALGDVADGADVVMPAQGGVTCTYTVANQLVTAFACDNAAGDAITITFFP